MNTDKGKTSSPPTAPKSPAKSGGKDGKPEPKPASKKPDPTRFGDWEKGGRCIDF